MERDIFLHFQLIGGIEPGEVAAGLDQFVLGVVAQRPEILQVPRIGNRGVDGSLHLEETDAQKTFNHNRQHEPRDEREAEREKRFGFVETGGRHDEAAKLAHEQEGRHGKYAAAPEGSKPGN